MVPRQRRKPARNRNAGSTLSFGPAAIGEPYVAFGCGLEYDAACTRVARGLVEARREGRRWLVNAVSLKMRKELLAGRLSGEKAC
jgi:hypothetical protein